MKKNSEALQKSIRVFDAWLPQRIQYDRCPGLSVGIVHNGKLVYKKGFGYADKERQTRATPQTCYRIASISKTFTAIAIMQLVQKKKLRLDDHIVDYVPWFKKSGANSISPTIRQLISHSAGIWRDGNTPHWATYRFPTHEQMRKKMTQKSFVINQNTHFKYSNFGFALLGMALERASGMSYERYIRKHIFDPLGMTHTWSDYCSEAAPHMAIGYGKLFPGREQEIFTTGATNAYAPATGFISNAEDLARYLSALSYDYGAKDALGISRELRQEMMHGFWKEDTEGGEYGLGFDVLSFDEKKEIVGHGGGFPGFISRIQFDPKHGIGIVVLTNSNQGNAGMFANAFFRLLYRFEQDGMHRAKTISNSDRYEGVYHSRWSDIIVVSIGSSLLAFNSDTMSPIKRGTFLHPLRKNIFRIDTPSLHDYIGEEARFLFKNNGGSACTLLWGAMPHERIQ